MKRMIYDLVMSDKYVSLARLSKEIPGFQGNLEWVAEDEIVLWNHCSKEAIGSINELMKKRQIGFVPCPWTIYLFDGILLTLPIFLSADHLPGEPCWLPIVLVDPGIASAYFKKWNRLYNDGRGYRPGH